FDSDDTLLPDAEASENNLIKIPTSKSSSSSTTSKSDRNPKGTSFCDECSRKSSSFHSTVAHHSESKSTGSNTNHRISPPQVTFDDLSSSSDQVTVRKSSRI